MSETLGTTLVERLEDVRCDREPFTDAHKHCICRLTNEAAREITTLRAQLEEARALLARHETPLLDRDVDRAISAGLMESLERASRYSEPITLDSSAAADIWGETVRSRGKIFHLGRKVEEARRKAIEECIAIADAELTDPKSSGRSIGKLLRALLSAPTEERGRG